MKRARAALNRTLLRLGVPGVAGIGLLLFALGLYQSTLAPGQARVAAMQAEAARHGRPGALHPGVPLKGGPLADFYAFFPPMATMPRWLEKVYAMARAQGLDVPKGKYHLVSSSQEPIVAYEAVFPIRGSYPRLRRFVAAVLNELPFASLDDLRLEKQKTTDQMVDARIKLTFYLRAR